MRSNVCKTVINSQQMFSVLLDESTSLSKKSCLIVYLRAPFNGQLVTFNLDLVELSGSTAIEIKEALISTLKLWGFNEEVLSARWLGLSTVAVVPCLVKTVE